MGKGWLLVPTALLLLAAFALFVPASPENQPQASNQPSANRTIAAAGKAAATIKLASWNLQIFGEKKAQNATIMESYSRAMGQYDIVFIEEIRDSSGSAFPKLCAMMDGYRCLNSSRSGRSASKEQYGVIYKGVNVTGTTDYNPDGQDRWERPPFGVTFGKGNYSFTVLAMHTKPDNTAAEMAYLDMLASNLSGNTVVLGDLNADCSYYPVKKDFANWTWAIRTGTDTTSGNTSCTYDRMIFNPDMAQEYAGSGVFSENITSGVSDHYLVWSQFAAEEKQRNTS